MKKNTVYFIVLIIIICIGIFTIFNSKKDRELETVRLNEVVHSIFYAPQYVAIEKGFFEEEGLTIDLTVGQGADKSMVALISGSADISLMGTEAGIYVYNEGKEDYAVSFLQPNINFMQVSSYLNFKVSSYEKTISQDVYCLFKSRLIKIFSIISSSNFFISALSISI